MSDSYTPLMPRSFRSAPPPLQESTWHPIAGHRVHIERHGVPSAGRRVVFLHGGGGHAGLLRPFAAEVARRGVYVVVPDLPGYGRTEPRDKPAVRYTDWIEVASEVVRAEHATCDGELVVVGASMGGLLGYEVAMGTGVVDQLIATCFLDPGLPAARRQMSAKPWMGPIAVPLLRVLAGPLARVQIPMRMLANMRAIGNDPALVRTVLADELGGGNTVPLGFLRSFLDHCPAVAPEDAGGLAVVLAHPAQDRWTPVSISMPFFARLAGPKRLIMLAGAGHMPIEEPGASQLVAVIAGG